MAVENACDCVSENFLRIALHDNIGRKEHYYCFPPQGRKKRSGQNTQPKKRLRSSINIAESFEMPHVPYPWKIDDDGKKFLRKCNLQFNLFLVVGNVGNSLRSNLKFTNEFNDQQTQSCIRNSQQREPLS